MELEAKLDEENVPVVRPTLRDETLVLEAKLNFEHPLVRNLDARTFENLYSCLPPPCKTELWFSVYESWIAFPLQRKHILASSHLMKIKLLTCDSICLGLQSNL